MAANTAPIFTLTPKIGIGGAIVGPSANTALDGTGANSTLIFTAGSFGSRVNTISLKAVGSPAATIARIFYCSDTGSFTPGTTNTTSNTALLTELSVPAITVSNVNSTADYQINFNQSLPASTKLFITFGTSTGASGTGYAVAVFGGDY